MPNPWSGVNRPSHRDRGEARLRRSRLDLLEDDVLNESRPLAPVGFDHFFRQRLLTSFDVSVRSTAWRIVTSFEGIC